MNYNSKLVVETPPHLHSRVTVPHAMLDVIIALLPVTLVSIYFYKLHSIFLIFVCLITAVLTEIVFRKAMQKPLAIKDGSALVTGLFVALLHGPGTPWWSACLATFIGVGLAKELMGGLGWNRFNPALFGRFLAFLIVPVFAYTSEAFGALRPYLGSIDVTTQATPLALMQQGMEVPGLSSLFLAYPGGALGETSVLALLIGAAYLFYKKHIGWHIPVSIISTTFVLGFFFGGGDFGFGLFQILSGGVVLGAFFMATDWVTAPITPRGKVIFGVSIGFLLTLFRVYLPPTEGMAFSILIMNALVPMIDRLTRRAKFGESIQKQYLQGQVTENNPATNKN